MTDNIYSSALCFSAGGTDEQYRAGAELPAAN